MRDLDVVVIGGGHAGLAAGYHLARTGRSFTILEAAPRTGDSWRKRYRSLTLFTPRLLSALPGRLLNGDPNGYPDRTEFADYLETYAESMALPVQTSSRVIRLTKSDGGFVVALADDSRILARSVIVATGGFQVPIRPSLAEQLSDDVTQLDSGSYFDTTSLPEGPVLIVGDGAFGRDVAFEIARTHDTWLAIGKPRRLFPERVLGKSIWWWLNRLALTRVQSNTFLGRAMRKADPFPDRNRNNLALEKAGVQIVPRLIGAEGNRVRFHGGRETAISGVVWAVGYREDDSWIDIADAKDRNDAGIHKAGISPVPGLYYLGRPWQRSRGSALVMGVGADAAYVTRHCAEWISGYSERATSAATRS